MTTIERIYQKRDGKVFEDGLEIFKDEGEVGRYVEGVHGIASTGFKDTKKDIIDESRHGSPAKNEEEAIYV